MTTGAARSGRMIAVPAALLGEDDGVGALARLDLGEERGARDLDRLRALRIGGGELGLVGVEEAVDDRRGEKLCEPLQCSMGWTFGGDVRTRFRSSPRIAGTTICALLTIVPRVRCAPSPRWGEGWGEGVTGDGLGVAAERAQAGARAFEDGARLGDDAVPPREQAQARQREPAVEG